MSNINPTLFQRLGGAAAISTIVDKFYANMQDDYRLNRFFNSSGQAEQIASLKTLIIALLGGTTQSEEEMTAILDHFFLTAFARNKSQSMVTGADWGFFGYIIAQNHPSTKYVCDSHSHLLKFMPDDSIYDAVIEQLTLTVQQLSIEASLAGEILRLAESARDPVLGK
jgi:hypothetical protein